MAKVFLDTNTFIDAIHRKPVIKTSLQLEKHISFISPLSVHIYCYLFKVRIPNQTLLHQLQYFSYVDLTENILSHSFKGPTNDLEDNIQLHSAAEAECDIFLTSDKTLLKMKFFGKTQIQESIEK